MRQKGFAPILAIILSLVLVGAAVLVYYQKQNLFFKTPKEPSITSIPNPNEEVPRMWGTSMLPTLKEGDLLNVNKDFDKTKLKKGDLVIYKEDSSSDKVGGPKRIIAMGGDTLKLLDGVLYLNGSKLKEDYLLEQASTSPGKYLPEGIETIIPKGTVFVMGDNRQHSADSRLTGPLDTDNIVGIVTINIY